MAELYLCSALGPEGFAKDVVIKRIRPHLARDPVFIDMFVAEARLASRLNHRNVIQIFDFDRHEDTYYLAMEYVRGASLWELRRCCRERCVAIPPVLAAHIGADVAHGLAYAHGLMDQGQPLRVVHRDVTPHNILLSFDGAVKLTDFGIARAGSSATAPGVLKGKYAYMSPEQARGEPVDSRTDIFALGIVVWEMLTGARLFEGDSDLAILRAVQRREIPPPARMNPDVPEALDAAVMRALERDAGNRYASASELARSLSQVVLQHARCFDDTDIGAFLRHVIGDVESGKASTTVESPALPARHPGAAAEHWHEPTAVMPGRGPGRVPQGRGAEPVPLERRSLAEEGTGETLVLASEQDRIPPGSAPEEGVPGRTNGRRPAVHQHLSLGEAGPEVPSSRSPWGSSMLSTHGWLKHAPMIAVALVVIAVASAMGFLWVGRGQLSSILTRRSAPPSHAASSAPLRAPSLQVSPHPAHVEGAQRAGRLTQEAVVPVGSSPPSGGAHRQGSAAAGTEGEMAPAQAAFSATEGADAGEGAIQVGMEATRREVETRPEDSPQAAIVKARRHTGLLILQVFPSAQVSIDGRDVGEVSGSRSLVLPVGGHRVVFQHTHRTRTAEVTVSAARPTEVEFNAFKVQ